MIQAYYPVKIHLYFDQIVVICALGSAGITQISG